MAIHKTEGIILSAADWSESSQTLTVFTPDKGKISLNVKGSRRINGKRGRPLRFARLEMTCYLRDGASSGYLSDIDPVEVFLFEKDGQLGRLTFASAALELLHGLLIPYDPQPACYQISLSFLRMVDSIEKKRLPGLFAGYILRLVSLLGFRPNLVGCVGCGRAIVGQEGGTSDEEPRRLLLSIERGGMVCDTCRQTAAGHNQFFGLPEPVHAKLIRLLESSLEEASQIPVSISDLNLTVEMITKLLIFHAGTIRELKSFDFLDKLARAVKTFGG